MPQNDPPDTFEAFLASRRFWRATHPLNVEMTNIRYYTKYLQARGAVVTWPDGIHPQSEG